ncbi:hypothetical protein [Catelliglobosispora koreensis]|uniref:hypothetical protein n=1 Tax=Catelliglobosispora koreensis TaxID=129052 RepID=UPI0003770A82|nr:hypothetical protein [Catelliglobosispora koreensis]
MTDYRMRDDQVFRDTLNEIVDEVVEELINEAFPDPSLGSMIHDFFLGESPLEGGVPNLPREGVEDSKEYWRTLYKQFRGWNITDGTAKVRDTIALDVLGPIRSVASVEFADSRPTDIVSAKLATWDGPPGSAAAVVRFEIMPELTRSLVYTLDVVRSLDMIMQMHENIVLSAREGILRIADQTLEKLGKSREARAEADDQLLKDLTQLAFSVATSEADPVKGVGDTLSAGGNILIGAAFNVAGSGFNEISASMVSAIENLAAAIRAEEELVLEALRQVDSYLNGENRYETLPPNVNPPSQTRAF